MDTCSSAESSPDDAEKEFFHLIIENDQTGFRRLLEDLSSIKRQIYARSKFNGKSPLILAVEQRSLMIAEDLLYECLADVHEVIELNGQKVTPLFAAIMANNLYLVNSFLRAGADVNWRDDENRNAIVFACHKKRISIAKALKEVGANINCSKNMELCLADKQYFKIALKLEMNINKEDDEGNTLFMTAIWEGKIKQANILLNKNIDRYHRNHKGANVLDVLVFNNQIEKIRYLIKHRMFTLTDKVLSLEYSGAYVIINNHEFDKGKYYWIRAQHLREKYLHYIKPKHLNYFHELSFTFQEFNSIADVDTIEIPMTFLFHALHVLVRLLSPKHPQIRKSFIRVIVSDYLDRFYEEQFALIDQLFFFNDEEVVPNRNSVFASMEVMINLCERYSENWHETNMQKRKRIFIKLAKFVSTKIWPFIGNHLTFVPYYFSKYKKLLELMLKYLDSMWVDRVSLKQDDDIMILLYKISRYFIPEYATTLLHIAISRGFPFEIVALLISTVMNVNILDKKKNTPLHLHLRRPKEDPDWERITLKLILSGSDLDAKNEEGLIPRNVLGSLEPYNHFINLYDL